MAQQALKGVSWAGIEISMARNVKHRVMIILQINPVFENHLACLMIVSRHERFGWCISILPTTAGCATLSFAPIESTH
jgi:hypothetical protein